MKCFKPRFSTIQIFLTAVITLMASAQQHLDAFVRIIDGMDKAGDVGIYRISGLRIEQLNQGEIIRTYFPASVEYTGGPAANVDVCRRYWKDWSWEEQRWISSTDPIADCTFDASSNMMEFPIPAAASAGFFMYELGELRNPSFSQTLGGFIVQILDGNENVLYRSNEMHLTVKINPNIVTE